MCIGVILADWNFRLLILSKTDAKGIRENPRLNDSVGQACNPRLNGFIRAGVAKKKNRDYLFAC